MKQTTFAFFAVFALVAAGTANAQGTPEGECTGSNCGAPNETGGGCGCGCGCSILIAMTDQGDTYQYADDFDNDGTEDAFDNCPFSFNPDQPDNDGDLRGDACDNCPATSNFDLADTDADGLGDLCDDDADADEILNIQDNCVNVPNTFQDNTDGDPLGDACDGDDDADGCVDADDSCPLQAEASCATSTAFQADLCDHDADADLIPDALDLCPAKPSVNADTDLDGFGDECDADLDNDDLGNTFDNCINVPNGDQGDEDRDGRGDACDPFRCFVITDESSCLDPAAPFTVHAGATIEVVTGKETLLPIFANRENKAIKYTWTVVEGPSNKSYDISNPSSSVSTSRSVQYFYDEGREAKFVAYTPGEYTLELLGELSFADDQYQNAKTSVSRVKVKVSGDPVNTFCAAAPGSTVPAVALLGLLGLARRRRQK